MHTDRVARAVAALIVADRAWSIEGVPGRGRRVNYYGWGFNPNTAPEPAENPVG